MLGQRKAFYRQKIPECRIDSNNLIKIVWLKVCLQGSKISKICLFGHLTGQATSWKANFENYCRYSLITWYQFLSILYNMSNTSFHSRHRFLLSARSSQSDATLCLSLMSHHWVNNKCNRIKGRHWRWLIYTYIYIINMVNNNMLCVSEATTTVPESFTDSTGKLLCVVSF